ncbi:hypothetical protein CR513_16665, partial [Mucuna pruriens]
MKCALDTRKAKQSVHRHKYATRLRSKVTESKVEALEQKNQDLRGEGWNTENLANEEQEQHNVVNNGLVFNTSSEADPNPKGDSGAQHQTSGNPSPFVTHR